jgi:hypothetical protein
LKFFRRREVEDGRFRGAHVSVSGNCLTTSSYLARCGLVNSNSGLQAKTRCGLGTARQPRLPD